MISEATIDAQVNELDPDNFEADLAEFAEAQPHLMDYLTNEENGAFTAAEQELLLFAGLVIYRSVRMDHPFVDIIEGPQIAELEEANFSLLQEQKTRGFRERITAFFDQSDQEDLLAFIEDLLLDEENTEVTAEGREPLFISLKTVMDVLLLGES